MIFTGEHEGDESNEKFGFKIMGGEEMVDEDQE